MICNSSSLAKTLVPVLLLCLHLCVVSYGQTCSSTGPGEDPASSSCSRSKPCRADHPHEDMECVPHPTPFPYPSSLPQGITRCPTRNGAAMRCPSPSDTSTSLLLKNTISSVAVELNSIDYIRFAVNVSWDHSYNPTGGYEVRIKTSSLLVDCFCLDDPDLRGLYIDDKLAYPPLTYQATSASASITVEVLPLSSTTIPEDHIKIEATASTWPRSCLDINHSSSTCGLPVYASPSDIDVYGHVVGKEAVLDVKWHYETEYVAPTVYYVEVYNVLNINEFYTFAVTNANSIEISHLDSSTQYYVHVQPYVHCSGLANRTYTLGCGLWSKPVSPILYPDSLKHKSSERKP